MGIVSNLLSNENVVSLKKQNKEATISVRISHKEKEALNMVLSKSGISTSEYLRDYIKQTILMSDRGNGYGK